MVHFQGRRRSGRAGDSGGGGFITIESGEVFLPYKKTVAEVFGDTRWWEAPIVILSFKGEIGKPVRLGGYWGLVLMDRVEKKKTLHNPGVSRRPFCLPRALFGRGKGDPKAGATARSGRVTRWEFVRAPSVPNQTRLTGGGIFATKTLFFFSFLKKSPALVKASDSAWR